ncbi:hypothetical protein N7492_008762 [Penicillium capsulatum]|uniref:Uncharacterized protein n=1 Tax=Penicillium capsulatum TaxID=69766 RepID=A0A9W9HVW8_9EURO|nr:hypothetical protein N7492_008762 [Penicillium capsulatum]KAJ6106166.1 hypothetical protein N7512_009683 [Penicillium capsulatum]
MASVMDQFFVADPADWVDFDQFLDIPAGDDHSAMAPSTSPEMALPYDADILGGDMPEFMQPVFPDSINHGISQENFPATQSPNVGLMPEATPMFDNAMFDGYQPYDESFQFRQMVEAQAAADQSVASIKEKRRDASIALHLQRLCDAAALDLDLSSDSSTSFSSPSWSEYMRESISPQPASSSPEHTPVPPPAAGNGGVELVLDLNMNTTTNLPKKQKPRSQAQKENYIKARKYGACEKHKKQHKRCNCLEKAAARAGVPDVPMNAAFKEWPRQPSILVPLLPDMRSSAVPGHDPSRISPMPRPSANLIEKSTNSSPGHDPGVRPTNTQQFIRVAPRAAESTAGHNPQYTIPGIVPVKAVDKNIAGSPGHDPRYSVFAVQQPANNTGRTINSISGHDSPTGASTRPSPESSVEWKSVSQKSGPPRATVQPTLRWHSPVVPSGQLEQISSTENNYPRQNTPTTDYCAASNSEKPNVQVRRPRNVQSSSLAEHRSISPMATPNESMSGRGVRSSGCQVLPRVDGRSTIVQSSRQPRPILSSLSESSPRDQGLVSTGKSWSGLLELQNQIVSHLGAEIGGALSSTLSVIIGTLQSSRGLFSWAENTMIQCVSFTGRHLMSAQKGLNLFQSRNMFSG